MHTKSPLFLISHCFLFFFMVSQCPLLFGQTLANDSSQAPTVDTSNKSLKRASVSSHDIPQSQSTIEANVFTLDARTPSLLSVYRNYNGKDSVVINSLKLEMKTKQTSAFRIVNINPLRYNYYLNGQLVSQFFDSSPANSALNELSGSVPVNDVVSLDVFSIDKEVLNQKIEIDKAKEELKALQKNVDAAQKDLNQFIDSSYDLDSTTRLKDLKELNKQYKKKQTQLQNSIFELNYKLNDLNMMLSKLAINANSVSIITGLKVNLGRFRRLPTLHYDISRMDYYIEEYLRLDTLCKEIKDTLNEIPIQAARFKSLKSFFSYSEMYKTPDKRLLQLLEEIKYPTENLKLVLYGNDPTYVAQQQLEIFRIEEFITDKKISSLGNLLTGLYLEVGKLLQNSHLDFSRQLNRIKNLNYITQEDEAEVTDIAERIKNIFNVIQTVNAHVSVLRVFMQVNNSQASDLGKTINPLYKSLLNFLKITDYIRESTTSRYTLAMHPNGSNIDLIRYTVKQEDVLTKNTQSYVYDIWLKGGIKIDFSIGIFATGLMDEAYEKNSIFISDGSGTHSSDTAFSFVQKDSGKFGFSFGGMVNISPRLGASWITPGLSIGVAYGDNQNLQFLAAGSLSLGKSERILLHAGYVIGSAKVLDRSAITYIDDAKTQVRGDISNYPVPLVEKFQGKFIFGISYNLSKKNALQAVSGQGLTKFNSSQNPVE